MDRWISWLVLVGNFVNWSINFGHCFHRNHSVVLFKCLGLQSEIRSNTPNTVIFAHSQYQHMHLLLFAANLNSHITLPSVNVPFSVMGKKRKLCQLLQGKQLGLVSVHSSAGLSFKLLTADGWCVDISQFHKKNKDTHQGERRPSAYQMLLGYLADLASVRI